MKKIPQKELELISYSISQLPRPSVRELNIQAMAKEILDLRQEIKQLRCMP